MKRVLIVGTSHSEATCQRTKDSLILRIENERWHDYFKNVGCEVTCIARAGCTPELQFMAVHAYLQEHPDATFDFALIEGRSLETNITMPGEPETEKLVYEHHWKRYDTSRSVKEFESRELLAIDSFKIEDMPEYKNYYIDYMFSLSHAVNLWTTNYALCNLIKTRCPVVKWFAFSTADMFVRNREHRHIRLGYDIMQEFLLDEEWWPAHDLSFNLGEICACKHLNEAGHKRFWKEYIYPRIQQYI